MKRRNKHIRDFEKEKLRLKITQLELEKQLRKDWTDLKNELSVSNLFTSHFGKRPQSKRKTGLFSGVIDQGLEHLTAHISSFAGQKIASGMKKGIDGLIEKVGVVFRNR